MASAIAGLSLITLTACGGAPRATGNPDPGGHLMAELRPVLTTMPPGAHVLRSEQVTPSWDSCDGVTSTYGWDPVTVDADFSTTDSEEATVAHLKQSMATLGWSMDAPAGTDWTWHKTLANGAEAVAQLLDPSVPGDGWSLQASVPAATHPVAGC